MVTRVAPKPRTNVVPVECAGDHESMGAAQGRATAAALAGLDRAIVELMAVPLESGLGKLARSAGRFAVPALGRVARRLMARDLKRHYPRQYDRMAGIARAGGVPLSWLFVGPGVEVALNRVSYVRPGACTAIAVTGSRARRGEPMIVKNFDYPDAARDTYLVRVSRPARHTLAPSIDVTAAPLAGSHEGINEHGLAIAYNYGYFTGRAVARIPITNLVQEVLEQCRTVDEALAHIARRPRSGAAILMIADAGGELVSVELGPDAMGVRRASDCGDALAHANHGVTEMAERDVPHDAVLSRWNPPPVRGHRVHQSSEARHARAEQLLDDAGVASERDLIAIAGDHAASPNGGDDTDDGDDDTICRHGPYYRTTCSVVLFPQRRTMKVMFAAPCEADYTEVSL
jgi:hypothetical protein